MDGVEDKACCTLMQSLAGRFIVRKQIFPTKHIKSPALVLWAPFQYPIRRLTVRSRNVSKPRDLYLELSDRSEIWQAPRQQGCRSACQISKRCDNLNYKSRGLQTSRDLTITRLIGYWNGALVFRCDLVLNDLTVIHKRGCFVDNIAEQAIKQTRNWIQR